MPQKLPNASEVTKYVPRNLPNARQVSNGLEIRKCYQNRLKRLSMKYRMPDKSPNASKVTKCLRKLANASEVSKCLTNHQMPQNYFTLPNAVGFPPNAPSRHRIPLKRPSMIGSCLIRIACEAAFGWSHHYRFV